MTTTQLGALRKMEGQLIGMTEWALPLPEPEALSEVPCPRP
jgi:hypothetical protein